MYRQKGGSGAVKRNHSGKEESRPIYVDLVYTIRSSPRLGPEVCLFRMLTADPIIDCLPLYILSGRRKAHVGIESSLTRVGAQRDGMS